MYGSYSLSMYYQYILVIIILFIILCTMVNLCNDEGIL